MDTAFERLSKALEAQSSIDIDGTPFAIWLINIRDPSTPGGTAVDVIVGAKSQSDTHIGELHLGATRLKDEDYVVEQAIATIKQVVRGELPPGARALL